MNNTSERLGSNDQLAMLPWHRPEVQELDISDGTRSGVGTLVDLLVGDTASVASVIIIQPPA